MTKPIFRLMSCIALLLCISLSSGCAESSQPTPTGKGKIRGINSIVDAPELLFQIEERNIGVVNFRESSNLSEWDDLAYNFNFDFFRPNILDPERVATEFIDVIADTEYTLILAGDLDNPSIIRWDDPEREWSETETVWEAIFTHQSPVFGQLDIYFAAPGTTPVLGASIGTLVNGERLPITEYEQGEYEIILTPPGDPSTILYTSPVITSVQQNRVIFAIFDPDPTTPEPFSVNLIGQSGASVNLADPSIPSTIRLLHASFSTENVDGYFDMDFNDLKFPNVGHTELSAYTDIAEGIGNVTLTPVGNIGAEILGDDVITLSGTIRTLVLAGVTGNLFFNVLAEDGRPLSTFPLIRIANLAVNYAFVDVYIEEPGTDITDIPPRFFGLSTQMDTGFVPAIDGMRELTVTNALTKDIIAAPLLLDLSTGEVVSIGLFDTVDPLVLEALVYDTL
jgi:hypothetical protein